MFLYILSTYLKTIDTTPKEKLPKSMRMVDLFLNKMIKSAGIVDDTKGTSCNLHKNIVCLKAEVLFI
jgi:hypothetical protein